MTGKSEMFFVQVKRKTSETMFDVKRKARVGIFEIFCGQEDRNFATVYFYSVQSNVSLVYIKVCHHT